MACAAPSPPPFQAGGGGGGVHALAVLFGSQIADKQNRPTTSWDDFSKQAASA